MNGIDICKPAVIRFAEFELDLRTAQLRVGGVLRKLQPQPAKVLGLLAVASGALVSREQEVRLTYAQLKDWSAAAQDWSAAVALDPRAFGRLRPWIEAAERKASR